MIGYHQLLRVFRKRFCDLESASCPVRSNDFSNFTDYFLQKGIVEAFGRIGENGDKDPVPEEAIEFVLSLAKFNDNSINKACFCSGVSSSSWSNTVLQYSDASYVAAILDSLTSCALNGERHECPKHLLKQIVSELQRYLILDRFSPSFQNLYSQTALRGLMRLQQYGLVPKDLRVFMFYSQYGHYEPVRLTALEALIRLALDVPSVWLYLLELVRDDPTPFVQVELARMLAELVKSDDQGTWRAMTQDAPDGKMIQKELWTLLR